MTKEKQSPDMQNQEQDKSQFNLRFYMQGCEVPIDAQKKIAAGRIKGMTDVNPMWRMKKMTEIFGPCGIGWKYVIDRQWTETYGQEVKCFCNVLLYIRDPQSGEWSEPIPGNGGSSLVALESKGPYVNDEGYKMALTDALSIAMKPLGIGANIWYGPKATGHSESKYETSTYADQQCQYQQLQGQYARGTSALAFTGAQLEQSIAEMNAVTDDRGFEQVWTKWAHECPAICGNSTEFYKAACAKRQALDQANAK